MTNKVLRCDKCKKELNLINGNVEVRYIENGTEWDCRLCGNCGKEIRKILNIRYRTGQYKYEDLEDET